MTQVEGERGAKVRFPPPLVYLASILLGVAMRYPLLSDALKLFKVQVSQKEEEAETELVSTVLAQGASGTVVSTSTLAKWITDAYEHSKMGTLSDLLGDFTALRIPGKSEESSE